MCHEGWGLCSATPSHLHITITEMNHTTFVCEMLKLSIVTFINFLSIFSFNFIFSVILLLCFLASQFPSLVFPQGTREESGVNQALDVRHPFRSLYLSQLAPTIP